MIIKLILTLIVLVVAFSLLAKYQKLSPAKQRSWAIKAVIGVVVIALIAGTLTGRVPAIAGIAALAATVAKLGWRFGLPLFKLWFASSGGNASFRSQYLHITVNVTNGQMQGTVLKGEFAEQPLSHLTDEQLQQLLAFFNTTDKKSYYLLNAYIRSKGFSSYHQNDTHGHQPPASQSGLSRAEALEILGLSSTPTKSDIIAAHRRLISKLHPDKGGSDYLAARVNQARDLLLKSL